MSEIDLVNPFDLENYREYKKKVLDKQREFDTYYRGHGTEKYRLVSTAARWLMESLKLRQEKKRKMVITERQAVNSEFRVLKKFYDIRKEMGMEIPENIDDLLNDIAAGRQEPPHWITEELYDLAALARHKGIPTRLLDWSMNPYVSTYFAAASALKNGCDAIQTDDKEWKNDNMVIWEWNYKSLYSHFDTVQDATDFMDNLPLKGFDAVSLPFENSNAEAQDSVLFHHRVKPPYKKRFVELSFEDMLANYIIKFYEERNLSTDRFHEIKILNKYTMPAPECSTVVKEMKKLGYCAMTMYPNNDKGVEEQIKEDDGVHQYDKCIGWL